MNKSIPELSVESKLLYERLQTLEFDEFIPYEELTQITGRNVQEEGRGNLQRAKLKCLKDNQIHIATVISKGVKRIHDADVVKGGNALKKITRCAARRRLQLHSVNYAELTKELQTAHNAELSQLGVIRIFSNDKATKKLIGHVEKGELPIGKTLEFFTNGKE